MLIVVGSVYLLDTWWDPLNFPWISVTFRKGYFPTFKRWKFNQRWFVLSIGGWMPGKSPPILTDEDSLHISSYLHEIPSVLNVGSKFMWSVTVTGHFILSTFSPRQGQKSNSDVIWIDNLKSITLGHGTFILPPLVWNIDIWLETLFSLESFWR